jgi:two-component system chemotaxis response regulator CheB
VSGSSSHAFDVVVIVASLGGPDAVRTVLAGLPAGFPAAILVVQHRTAAAQYLTVDLLRQRTRLEVVLAGDGDRLCPGSVHVAPADRQLLLVPDGRFAWGDARRPTGYVADALCASVAMQIGPRALGVILSGANDDGARGTMALKLHGGRVLAQDRASARCFTMPAAAIATGCVDFVLPVSRIAPAVVTLTMLPGAADFFQVALPSWARLTA